MDGYGNRRVIVFDAATGAYKRHWGAYGNKPDDNASKARQVTGPGPQQFNTPHGIAVSNDGVVYVADRGNNRVQSFRLDGTFLREGLQGKPQQVRATCSYSRSADALEGGEPAAAFRAWPHQGAGQGFVDVATCRFGRLRQPGSGARSVVTKAREFDVKDVVTDPGDASNSVDDGMLSVLEDHPDDPVVKELTSFIRALTEDEQIDLVALTCSTWPPFKELKTQFSQCDPRTWPE